jgi:uncharacterized membrane protein
VRRYCCSWRISVGLSGSHGWVPWADIVADEQSQERAFLWTVSRGLEDLNRVYASLLTDGSVLEYARAISADGRYIVGYGWNATALRTEAFLLDTVPEPSSFVALGVGLFAIALRRRHRRS